MKHQELENGRYKNDDYTNAIELEERIMFSWLPAGGGRLLDIGCGAGNIAAELAKRGFEVTGIDFAQDAVAQAQKRGIDAQVCDVDENGLPFEDNSLDVIWAGDVVEHVFDPIYLFKEMARTLKPQGTLLLSTPNVITIKQRFIIALTGRSPQTRTYRDWNRCKHHTVFSYELLKYMLTRAGLKIERLWGVTQFPGMTKETVIRTSFLVPLLGAMFLVRAGKANPD